jgi:hypothetical protein
MKQRFVLGRWALAAGLCLLLAGILTVSLVWATAFSSPPPTATTGASRFPETTQASSEASQVPRTVAADPAGAVREAWERARDAGIYAFATDLTQVAYPARTLTGAGRGPDRAELHMEGNVDQPARTLQFRMWQGGGGALAPGSGAEARIEGDRAYLRPAGGEWKEAENFSGGFAPGNDPLAFLAGIKDVREVMAKEQTNDPSRITQRVARFSFQLDGRALAAYMRDQLERQLTENGELPLNVTLDAPGSFREMTGNGELWVDGAGLPLRLTMHLVFPEQVNGSHLEAEVQTDFSGFPAQTAAAPAISEDPLAWAGAALSAVSLPGRAVEAGSAGGALACGLGLTALLLACRRSRRLYAAVVIAVIFSMVVVPVMQDQRAAAFFERRAARAPDGLGLGAPSREAAGEGAAEQVAGRDENLAPSWDPHRDPLALPSLGDAEMQGRGDAETLGRREASPRLSFSASSDLPASAAPASAATPSATALNCSQSDTTDSDGDGVNDYEECVYDLDPGLPDKDGDGLTDGQELNKLGTDATKPDTDGDMITDTLEVEGFMVGGKHWYLNPNHPDTNNDGLTDSVECPVLVDVANPTEEDYKNSCDSDQDGVPNPFEVDNDGDGVADRVDMSPYESLDSQNNRHGQATDATAFNSDQPFLLSLAGLQQGWPALVDLQMRPVTPTHLAYTNNVLDWPSGDIDGQLQHFKGTTFATSDNVDIANPQDEAGANGDIRLVPMLEIVMTGAHVPLPLTDQVVTATVRGEISATIKLTPTGNNLDTNLHFLIADPWTYEVGIYDSACPISGDPAQTFANVGNGRTETYAGKKLVDLADGQHAMLIRLSQGTTQACVDIPDMVNGPYSDKMIDQPALSPYGITVKDRDGGDPAVVAYVPLNVTPDDTGGGKSAFQAHMVYYPGEGRTWDEPQQMRIIWLVEMLTDSCDQAGFTTDKDRETDPEGYDAALRAWCGMKEHRTVDQVLPVQVYDESWYLTGLSVREDHGLDVAVAYANPNLAAYDDDGLWTLSWGLGQQFATGRDCETRTTIFGATAPTTCKGDKRRDLSIFSKDALNRPLGDTTIQERFNITTTVSSSNRYRWGIPNNALRVESFRYPSQDYVGYLAGTETPRILKDLQGKYGAGISPTLLFAHEERFRSADLESAEMPSSGVLTLDVSNTTDYPEQTAAGLLWSPFRYNKDAGKWESYPSSDYWDPLEVDLEARFQALYQHDPADTNAGRAATARAYYYGLMIGVTSAIHCTPEESSCPNESTAGTTSDEAIRSANAALGGLRHVADEVLPEAMGLGQHVKTSSVPGDAQRNGLYVALEASLQGQQWSQEDTQAAPAFNWVGQTLQGAAGIPYIVFRAGPAIPAMANLLVGGAVIALNANLFVASQAGPSRLVEIANRVYYMAYTAAGVFSTVKAAYAGYKLAKTAESFMTAAKAAMGFRNYLPQAKLSVLTTVVFVVAEWACFALEVAIGYLSPGTVAFNEALVEAIAYTVLSVVLFVIWTSLGPLGDILSGLWTLINGLVGLICSYMPEDFQESTAADWICGGLTGFFTKYLASLYYTGTIMVDLDPDEDEGPPWYPRLNLHHFGVELVDPDKGMVTGSAMRYSLWLTNTIDLVGVPLRRQEIFWAGQFDEENLRKSDFDYRWQEEQNDFHDPLSLGGMKDAWHRTKGGRPLYYTDTVATDTGFLLRDAGINRPVESLYLSEAYAVPAQQCWGYKEFKYCYISAEKDTIHYDLGSGLIYDILPATLDGFYTVARKGDGWALAWGQQGDLTFPTLNDADGDGLLKTSDPNDSKWDADDDGLSDVYEIGNGSDPRLADGDDDGLTDTQEAELGSDPTNPDSDADGLYDCQEVFHQVVVGGNGTVRTKCGNVGDWSGGWSVVYGMQDAVPLTTLVTSNPADVDSEGDGLTDSQEKIYGYNPGAYSDLNVLSLNSTLSEVGPGGAVTASDGFVLPGQTLYYSATVKNELDNRQAEGLLWNKDSKILDNSKLQPEPFNLAPQHDVNMAGNLNVLPDAGSGAYSLTQVAGALIADLTVEADDATLWLPFDDPAGSTVFADHSGQVPAHDGRCVGDCPLQPADGRVGGALDFNGSGYVHSDATIPATGYAVSLWFRTAQGGELFFVESPDHRDVLIELRIDESTGAVDYLMKDPGSPSGWESGVYGGFTHLNETGWHHLVHTFGGPTGTQKGQRLYLDGALVATGNVATLPVAQTGGVDIGGCSESIIYPCRFSGWVDDVRLFDHALTQPEVQELFQMPVFKMDFDQADGWVDVSSFPTAVTCVGADCPTHKTTPNGGAATFNGNQYLSVSPASELNLSGGRLTLAAWIYPRTRGSRDARDSYAQSILGLHSGGSDAFPTLQRVGRKLLFGLGTGSAYLSAITTRNVLSENQWNHVAVTLDKEEGGHNLRFYVNGDLVEEQDFTVTAIAPTANFEIGRSDPMASVGSDFYMQYDNGDDTGAVEMCMTIGGQEVWNQGSIQEDDDLNPGVRESFNGSTAMVLWEDDGDTRCGTKKDDHDDLCTIDGWTTEWVVDTDNVGDHSGHLLTDCGEADISIDYENNAIPFYGDIDEVQIFAQPLDQDAIKRLYLDIATLLHLPLDEAPGAEVFQDTSFAYVSASCNRAPSSVNDGACPASGTSGRLNLAAQFDSGNHNVITLGHSAANELAESFTVAAWIKPNSLTGSQRIVSTARTKSNNGWGFGFTGSQLLFSNYGLADHTKANLALQPDRWYHVAAVSDATNNVSIYVNGVLRQTFATVGYGLVDADDLLLVGATTEPNSATPSQLFDGQIDDVRVFNLALTPAQINELYDAAPILQLSFEEAQGATQFADNAVYGRTGDCTASDTTHACPLAGEAVRGQVGLAAAFDGVDDRVEVAGSAPLTPTIFSVGAWVMPIAANKNPDPATLHELVGKWKDPAGSATNFRLYMADDLKPGLEWGCSGTSRQANADVALIQNHWNHVMGTFDGQWLRIYVNGIEHGSYQLPIAASCKSDQPVEIGGKAGLPAAEFFNGRLDEVVVYDRVLTPGQISDLYDYQVAWFEDRQSRNITVDDDLPTAQVLMTGGAYLARREIVVGVAAADPTSGVAGVEMGADQASTPGVWVPAAPCAPSSGQPDGAWCATFAPSSQGAYTLLARASDRAGHDGEVGARVPVYVDDTPPDLKLGPVEYDLLNVAASDKKPQTWVVHLSGTVEDASVANGVSGSGVPADGVHVTLRDADGNALGEVGQVAILSGTAWSVDYTIPKAKTDGCFEVEVEAVDQVARLPDLDPTQVGQHTSTLSRWVVLDASAPAVLLDQNEAIAGGQIVSTTQTLGGESSTRPVPVKLDLTTATGADQTRVRLSCQHGNGAWYTLFDLEAGTLKADSTQHWEGEIHQGSACRVELTTSAPSGGVSGIVTVCREQVPGGTWTGDFSGTKAVDFTAQSDSCAPPHCPANSSVTGVQGVDVAFRSVLPGSAFVNETPLSEEIVHLPFEDILGSDGGSVRDVSGAATGGSCASGSCPISGQSSPSGSAVLFDGVNDSVRVPQVAGQGTTSYLTLSAWIYPTKRPDGSWNRGTFVSRYGLWDVGCTSDGLIRWVFRNTDPGNVLVSTGYIAPLNQWTHIAVVYDNGVIRTYVNGGSTPVHTYNGSGAISNANVLDIGGEPPWSEWFTGGLDDVRLFNRALSVDEIRALYIGSGPLLTLSFEKPWAANGAILTDDSGWGHDGALQAGASDAANKSVSGQVGSHALQFDGTDDYVTLGDLDAADGFRDFALAQWFSLDALGAASASRDWAAPLGKGAFSAGSGWAVLVDRDSANTGNHKINLYLNGAVAASIPAPSGGWQTGKWYHYAFTRGGGILKGYLDGVQKASVSNSVVPAANSSPILLGKNDIRYYWQGKLDEARIYGRALPAQEIADLYHAGWQAATLPAGAAGSESLSWTAAVPVGLEGSYQVEMRGRDAAEPAHVEAVNDSSLLWRGEADNLAPRVTLSLNTATNQYTTVAEDYHLADAGFSSPCGPGVVTTRETFRSPWYLGSTGDGQKLYRLTAVCPRPAGAVTEQATACDSFGNCATVGATAAAQAAAGAIAAAAQPASSEPTVNLAPGAPDWPGGPGFEISTPAVVTASHYYEPRTIDLIGTVIARHGPAGRRALAGVQAAIADAAGPATLSEPAGHRPYTVTWTFPWRLSAGAALPDGVAYTAVVTATDQAGRGTTVRRKLVADVVPPAPVVLTLKSNGAPVEPGAIISETSPDLALTWTKSSDGSGLAPYQAVWRIQDATTTTLRTSEHDPAGSLETHFAAGEAQRISAGLAAVDRQGNERWQEFGSVTVDGRLTPDFITPFPSSSERGAGGEVALGWMESGCSLLGADRRVARQGTSGRWAAQRLYGTWDARALRLAWTGANWNGDGDLFIYLDTAADGTTGAFTPYPVAAGGTPVSLPSEMRADVLIWVQDGRTASLLRWKGSAWALESQLSAEQFRFDAGLNGGQTDLYLPFDLLGLSAGAPLGLLALAAEEPAPDAGLRVWAALPLANPVNSARVNRRLPLAPADSVMLMRHSYRWASLGEGVCPNGTAGTLLAEQHNDASLQLTMQSDPPAATASGVSGGLFWVGDPGVALSGPDADSLFGFMRPVRPPMRLGQKIAYTVGYRNDGSHTMKGAWLDLTAFGALELDPPSSIELGDIAPGAEGSVTFSGTAVQGGSSTGLAVALARLYAASDEPDARPLEWLAAARRVDGGAPEAMTLDSPAVAGPEAGWLNGHAYDESGVSRVELEIAGPSGTSSTLVCDVPGPASAGWSCPWDPATANGGTPPKDGARFTVRLRATDHLGVTGDWSAPYTIQVDAKPPTVTLAADTGAYPNRLVRGSALRLIGAAKDNHALGAVTVCLDGEGCRTADTGLPGAVSSRWSRWVQARGALDYVTKTLTIQAADLVGNRMGEPLELPVVFDNVAPVLGANQILNRAPLGGAATVLNGDVADGGPGAKVSVRVKPPRGEIKRKFAARNGARWWFDLSAEAPGAYTLWVDAEDLAGNVTTTGPFTVDVFCTDAPLVVGSLTMEPIANAPMSLTLTTVISNPGRDPLPAGIPVTLTEEQTPLARLVTLAPLGPGESQALSIEWAPEAARDYDIGVEVGRIGDLPNGPLCAAPGTARFVVGVRDLPLYAAWNLVSPPVSLSNSDVQVVQRGIDGAYEVLLGYQDGWLSYRPDRPQEGTLKQVDARHGYWIKALGTDPAQPAEAQAGEAVATWRMAGNLLTEDQPLPLSVGGNLVGYPPRRALTVTAALQDIAGRYGAALGFDRTALAYYPDLDASFNTLYRMAPGHGYWISATQAITLHYPMTFFTDTIPITATLASDALQRNVRQAESDAGVQPTYEWMNFYGKLALPDATDAPTGTLVLAVDPQGVICGATATWAPGQYGLLACYRDDPETAVDEGAAPGDTIRLVVAEGAPPAPGDQVIGEGTWTAHGARRQVPPGPPPPPTMRYGVYLPLVLRAELSGGVALGPAPQDQDTAPPLPEPVATP